MVCRNIASSLNHLLDVAVQADLATGICIKRSGYNVPILTSWYKNWYKRVCMYTHTHNTHTHTHTHAHTQLTCWCSSASTTVSVGSQCYVVVVTVGHTHWHTSDVTPYHQCTQLYSSVVEYHEWVAVYCDTWAVTTWGRLVRNVKYMIAYSLAL